MNVIKRMHKYFSLNTMWKVLPFILCLCFFILYSILSIVRHDHYQSFGYDLGINDQTVWQYSRFHLPITTIDPFPGQTKFAEHVELVYAFISPFYWIWSTRRMLLMVEAGFVCTAGIAVYLLARKKGLTYSVSLSLLISYLGFYGVQNVMWFDTHSASFAAAFLLWFIYFIETRKKWLSVLFFFLAITAKENIGLLTCVTSCVFYIRNKDIRPLLTFFILSSVLYVGFIFLIFFPHIVQVKYLYANDHGFFSNLNPLSMINTAEKLQVYLYSLLSFGFLPLLSPLYLIPALFDLATYFVVASDLTGAQGLYGQYRITLVPFLICATIMTISRYKKLNTWYIGIYLLICTCIVQYTLHLPLSYLSKSWFWHESTAVKTIESIRMQFLPKTASVVAQNNIVPHLSHRDEIYSLYPEKKQFADHSPCGQAYCDWFRWHGTPEYLFVDTSPEWDARHLLIDRDVFIRGLENLQKSGVIKPYKQEGTTILYRVYKNPVEITP